MKVGFIGVGTMGAPMAGRLIGGGHDVTVLDRDAARVDLLVERGARRATDALSLGAASEVVFVSLPNGAALEAAVLDEQDGVLADMSSGAVIVDLSTNSRALAERVGRACLARGISPVDAPVSSISGSPDEGKLTMMVGGDADAVAAVRPLLELLAINIVALGPHGSGTAGKLLTQYLALTNMVAGMEAMLCAVKAGVNVAAMLDLVQASNGDSHMFRMVRQVAEIHDFGTPGQINGLVEIMNKDISYAAELAADLGVPHAVGGAAAAAFADSMARGHAPYHFTRVVEPLEESAGVELRITEPTRGDSS